MKPFAAAVALSLPMAALGQLSITGNTFSSTTGINIASTTTQVQEAERCGPYFKNTYIYGDSLADTGAWGYTFTIQSDEAAEYPTWAERVATIYGDTKEPCHHYVGSLNPDPAASSPYQTFNSSLYDSDCPNVAVAGSAVGARTDADGTIIPEMSLAYQVGTIKQTFLGGNGGYVAEHELVVGDIGANDLIAMLTAQYAMANPMLSAPILASFVGEISTATECASLMAEPDFLNGATSIGNFTVSGDINDFNAGVGSFVAFLSDPAKANTVRDVLMAECYPAAVGMKVVASLKTLICNDDAANNGGNCDGVTDGVVAYMTLPQLSITPLMGQLDAAAGAVDLLVLSDTMSKNVGDKVAALIADTHDPTRYVVIDLFAYSEAVFPEHSKYGFVNVDTPSCPSTGATTSYGTDIYLLNFCTPTTAAATVGPDYEQYFWADLLHPTPLAAQAIALKVTDDIAIAACSF